MQCKWEEEIETTAESLKLKARHENGSGWTRLKHPRFRLGLSLGRI